ncbi:MAG TPA: VOC family protein [Amycolatopsis sp.]|nr:VOC family protein [Amycolatopsis sp.]
MSRGLLPISSTTIPSGMPCWVELATVDETVAQDFYGRLFGWTYRINRDPVTPTGRYLIASLGTLDVGGLYRVPPEQASAWIVNLAVRSTVTAAEWVAHLGGTIIRGPIAIPRRGSILHALDPGGAPVVFWQPPADWDFAAGLPGTFAGADLNTRNGDATDGFFCRLFAYTAVRIGDDHDYTEWRLDRQPVLYRYVMGPEYPADTPPHWTVYFEVDPAHGADATAGRAIMLGGRVLVEPYDAPWGRTAVLADPSGAMFSIIDHARAEEWGRAEVDDPYDD